MTAIVKPTLKDLDRFYRDNEITLDEAFMRERGISWGSLSYEKKLAIYEQFHQQSQPAKQTTITEAAAQFTREHGWTYGKTALEVYAWQQKTGKPRP